MTDDTHKHEHVAVAINDLGDRLAMFRAPEFRHRFLACRGGGLQGVAGGTQVVRCARPRKSATGKGFLTLTAAPRSPNPTVVLFSTYH